MLSISIALLLALFQDWDIDESLYIRNILQQQPAHLDVSASRRVQNASSAHSPCPVGKNHPLGIRARGEDFLALVGFASQTEIKDLLFKAAWVAPRVLVVILPIWGFDWNFTFREEICFLIQLRIGTSTWFNFMNSWFQEIRSGLSNRTIDPIGIHLCFSFDFR